MRACYPNLLDYMGPVFPSKDELIKVILLKERKGNIYIKANDGVKKELNGEFIVKILELLRFYCDYSHCVR